MYKQKWAKSKRAISMPKHHLGIITVFGVRVEYVCVCVSIYVWSGYRHRRHCHREKHFATTAQST